MRTMKANSKDIAADVHYLGLVDVAHRIRAGALTSAEVTAAVLDRIAKFDGALGSYTTVLAERAMDRARTADDEIGRGLWRGPLHGVPVAVKDLCFTAYAPTAAGMHIHRDFVPDYDATVVKRLERAGAIIVGKLTMTEAAFSWHHPKMRKAVNPWSADVWPGVSSSGSGVATAAGLCFGSLGSDTGGSIRFPLYRLRVDRPEADVGQGEPLRHLPARQLARSHRPDGPLRRGRRRAPVRGRRLRHRRPNGAGGAGAELPRADKRRRPRVSASAWRMTSRSPTSMPT